MGVITILFVQFLNLESELSYSDHIVIEFIPFGQCS
jgi:hypothetical protein